MVGNLCVQSRPVRVLSAILPPSSRACIRYPSNLISWTQSAPLGIDVLSVARHGGMKSGTVALPFLVAVLARNAAARGFFVFAARVLVRVSVLALIAVALGFRPSFAAAFSKRVGVFLGLECQTFPF